MLYQPRALDKTLRAAAIRAAERWIAVWRIAWERRLDRLDEYLAERPEEPKPGSTS